MELQGLLTCLFLFKLWHRLLTGFYMPISFANLSLMKYLVRFSLYLRNRLLFMVLDLKSSKECLVNARVPKESTLSPTLFLPYIIDLPGYIFCNIAICTEKTTLSLMKSHLLRW